MKFNIFLLDKSNEVVKLGHIETESQATAEKSKERFFSHVPSLPRIKLLSVKHPPEKIQDALMKLVAVS